MTPTNELRFVERESYVKNGEVFREPFKLRVLQQKWSQDGMRWNAEKDVWEPIEEWRDVPCVKEDALL